MLLTLQSYTLFCYYNIFITFIIHKNTITSVISMIKNILIIIAFIVIITNIINIDRFLCLIFRAS
jgi:hypothetical protein